MARNRKSKRRQNPRTRILALGLVGAGLLAIGLVVLIMLPKGAGANAGGQDSVNSASQLPSSIPMEVNFSAPSLELEDLNGEKVALADFEGQVVLLNNWATWCPPCKAEMPTLQAYFEDHQAQGFTIVAVEAGEPVSQVAAFVEEYGLTFNVFPDLGQRSISAFRNMSLPNSFVIDRSGKVRLAWTGAISREMLEKYVTPLMEE
jgi:peroxiredoxin